MRVGNNSPVDQPSLQSQSTATKATPQQAPQTQSAFQGDAAYEWHLHPEI